MAARRPTRPTPPDVEVLRTALGLGKRVRVGIAPSSQFPDGVTGLVRRIGDPVVDGDEFIFVEVPVGGAKDVLPFAAADLIGSPGRKQAAAPAAAQAQPAQRRRPPTTPVAAPAVPARPTAAGTQMSIIDVPAVTPIGAPATTDSSPTPRPAASGRGKRAPVIITISTSGDDSASWRIEAKIGAKAAVRPTVIPPSRVWELVQSLREPKLTSLVQSLLDDHRRSTQARANALAAQLSALQEELNSFPADGSR